MTQEEKVYQTLADLEISYKKYKHPPVFTIEEANEHWQDVEGMHCKNIFIRDKKGRQHYLLIVPFSKQVNMKGLNEKFNNRFSFASPERLEKWLKLTPGSVSAFGLINDDQKHVIVILDDEVSNAEQVSFHPNINTRTLTISQANFKKFLDHCGNEIMLMDVN